MNSKELIDSFISGSKEGITSGQGNLKIKGDRLIHFQTTIAQRLSNQIIINMTRYSIVTGKIQKILYDKLPDNRKIIITRVAQNYDGLLSDYSEGKYV